MKQRLKHYVIVPVYNEEKNLETFLDSIVNQTQSPDKVVLVDDHSTDNTPKIISKYCAKYSKISYLTSSNRNRYTHINNKPDSKIIGAFYDGFETIKHLPFDLITKMDADLELSPHYFETINQVMRSNSKLGVVGGVCTILKNNKWVLEITSNSDHVRGALKSYKRECFETIKGLKPFAGSDVVDELLARYHGFEVKPIPNLKVKHLKPTGGLYRKIRGINMGRSMYIMRYGFLITSISALKNSYTNKSFSMIFDILIGYLQALKESAPKIVSEKEGKWIRAYRWKGIKKKIYGIFIPNTSLK